MSKCIRVADQPPEFEFHVWENGRVTVAPLSDEGVHGTYSPEGFAAQFLPVETTEFVEVSEASDHITNRRDYWRDRSKKQAELITEITGYVKKMYESNPGSIAVNEIASTVLDIISEHNSKAMGEV